MEEGISAIVTACHRIQQTLTTLEKIQRCQPAPAEILVHVDGNQTQCEAAIKEVFPDVRLIRSEGFVGPGGGRNKLLAAAHCEFVASFDDDSYPIDADYFSRVRKLFREFPSASILSAAIYERGVAVDVPSNEAEWVSDFAGGGCICRRSEVAEAGGYVPLVLAYGMEEVDLALRLHAQGKRILKTTSLRVFHDTDLRRHAHPEVTAGSIANLALLAYLRYPPRYWPLGMAQCVSRIAWLMRHGRWQGILLGLAMIPSHLRSYRCFRHRLTVEAVKSYLALRRRRKAPGMI